MPEAVETPKPIPPADGKYPGPEDHSKLWYLLVIGIELAVMASLIIVTRYTVQYRSGLNEPDKIRRIWARAPEIRFQPVQRPLAFAVAVSYGSQTVIFALISSLFALLGMALGPASGLGIIIGLVSVGLSSLISILVYRATGGDNWKLCAISTLGFDWFLGGVLLTLGTGVYGVLGDGFVYFIILSLAHLIVLAVIQLPFYLWGAYKRLPATARLIYNSSVVPNWVKLDRTIMVAAAPLAVIYLIAYICENQLKCESYLSEVTRALAQLMALSASALAAVLSVNRALLANEFQWQWRAFLTPAIPMGAMQFLISFLRLITFRAGFFVVLWGDIHFFLSCGGCGVLGAYVYLKLAEKYAQSHIDDDMLAQDDLLAEFDEDEDNEELDI